MMRLLRYTLLVLLVVVAAGAAAGAYLLQDPNRFKPELEALIERQSGIPLTIGGEISWRLWPPLSLSAAGLSAAHQGQDWQVGRLTLELDALKMLRNPDQWEVQSLVVNDVTVRQDAGVLTLSEVGVCEVQANPVDNPAPAPAAGGEDLIPVEVLLAYTWNARCSADWLHLHERRFENVSVAMTNQAGDARAEVIAPQFFGGRASADVTLDARQTPLRWTVTPDLDEVNSSELMAWLDQNLQWAAPLAYGGTLTFEGNTTQAMLASLSGETHFDGGQGSIDISTIRSQLMPLARMFNEEARIRGWPEVWDYERFVGTWQIQGQLHRLEAALDNLALSAAGDYDPVSDQLDMLAELVFTNNPDWPVFDVNPLLYDLPIPVHCRGSLAEPECRLDQNAARRIVAEALRGGESSELRRKLETKIDEDVPAEYRDAARSLLDLLGNSLKDPPPQ